MSAAGLISRFGQTVTIKRHQGGQTYVKGKLVDTKARTTFEITASVQPLNLETVQQLFPGMERNTHGIELYTIHDLVVANQKSGIKSDIVTYKNEDYEVQQKAHWDSNKRNLQHFRYVATKVNVIGGK